MRRKNRKIIIFFVVIVICFFSYKYLNGKDKKIENYVQNNYTSQNVEENEISNKEENNVDTNDANNEIYGKNAEPSKSIEINEEDKLKCVTFLGNFKSSELSNKQLLLIAYNVIACNYVENSDHGEFTKEEINNIIYQVVGRKLKSFESIDGLKLESNDKYVFSGGKEDISYKIDDLIDDVAAGTVYTTYTVYSVDSNENINKIGEFETQFAQNTEDSTRYIKYVNVSK